MQAESILLPGRIQETLDTERLGRRVYYLPRTDSTNRVAVDLARQGESDGTLVITDFQTRGKGRGGRRWIGPANKNILLSLILKPTTTSANALTLTLAFSLAVADALSGVLEIDVDVKWPNDVVVGGGKICGILSEGSSASGRVVFLVVGMGINVNMRDDEFPPDLKYPAVSCRSITGHEHDRYDILARVLHRVEIAYRRFEKDGFSSFLAAYVARLCLVGRSVRVDNTTGIVEGVAEDGALRIRVADGRVVSIYDGDVHVQ